MAIATDIEVTWVDTIDNTNKIGLSKTLNQLGANIFDSADYCVGYNNKALKLTKESESYPKSTDAGATNVPFYITNNVGYTKNTANTPEGVYYRTILFAVPNNFTWGWDANVRSDNSIVRIVTKLNLQKNKLYLTTAETQKNVLATAATYQVNESIAGTTANGTFLVNGVSYYINCADVYLTENGYYIKFQTYIDNMYDNFNATYGEGILGNFNYDTNSTKMYSASPVMFANAEYKVLISGSEANAYMIQNWNNTELDIAPDADNADIKFFATYSIVSPYYWHTNLKYSVEYALWISASYGLFFEWNGVAYKPVIQNGALKGYTNDMSTESDIDNWTDVSGHNISPTPPSPPTPGGDDDDNNDPISTAGAPFAAGIAHYYAMTAGSVLLDHVSEALGTWDIDTSKKDLYRNLISCKLIKPPAPIPTSGSDAFTIYGVKPQYQGADINLPVINGNPDNTFGPYTIDRKFYDFRDYAPYSKAEIYLPYCGWCALPSHVIGRSVTVKYFTDIIAATCKAVVFCGNNIVAEAAGVFGLDIPFAAENVGAKMAAVNAALLATAAGGVQLAAGVGSSVATKSGSGLKGAASGLSQYISGYSQMAMAFNENWTEISGKNGDGCCLAGATDIIIKITRPKYGASSDPPYVPAGYAHNVGYVSNKEITLGNAQGLVICDNADTSGISGATDAERAEIKRVLETGIYVNSPPE